MYDSGYINQSLWRCNSGLTSFIGDITGSYFKRQAKIKDYGNLLQDRDDLSTGLAVQW
jgi:CDP-diglyceride synthetase